VDSATRRDRGGNKRRTPPDKVSVNPLGYVISRRVTEVVPSVVIGWIEVKQVEFRHATPWQEVNGKRYRGRLPLAFIAFPLTDLWKIRGG